MQPVTSFDSVSSLGASHDKFPSPKEGFFTHQLHEYPSDHVQQHHTASTPYLIHPTSSSSSQQGWASTPAFQKKPLHSAFQFPASRVANSSDPKLVSVSDMDNFNQSSGSNNPANHVKAADASRNGYGASRKSSGNGLPVHGGPSGIPPLAEKGENQPKPNSKQGSTAGAAISQMRGAT